MGRHLTAFHGVPAVMRAMEELWARRVRCHLSRIQAVPEGSSSSCAPGHGRFRCLQVAARRLGEYTSNFLRKAVMGLAIGTWALLQLSFNSGLLSAREVRAACILDRGQLWVTTQASSSTNNFKRHRRGRSWGLEDTYKRLRVYCSFIKNAWNCGHY